MRMGPTLLTCLLHVSLHAIETSTDLLALGMCEIRLASYEVPSRMHLKGNAENIDFII